MSGYLNWEETSMCFTIDQVEEPEQSSNTERDSSNRCSITR